LYHRWFERTLQTRHLRIRRGWTQWHTRAHDNVFCCESYKDFFFVLLKYNGNNKSPRFRHTYNILYVCVCVFNTRYSGQLQLPPLSDFTKYVLRSGVGKNYPLRPVGNREHLGLSEVAVSRRHAHTQLCRRGPDDDNAKLYCTIIIWLKCRRRRVYSTMCTIIVATVTATMVLAAAAAVVVRHV